MDQSLIESKLLALGIDKIEYFKQITSTNDAANQWLNSGAEGRYLAFSDEQTAGRGRDGRKWDTPPNSALAFSIAFSKDHMPLEEFALVNGYLAVAICKALEIHYNLEPEIKWPNDILINGEKLAGILTEAKWQANRLQHLIIGIGINIATESIANSSRFNFPSTYLNTWVDKPLERADLLHKIVASVFNELEHTQASDLLKDWESRLAFKGESVEMHIANKKMIVAKLIGLDKDGKIRLQGENGKNFKFAAGEIRIRPIEESNKK